jgi:hypothetical protein
MTETSLVGRWRLSDEKPGKFKQYGFHAMEFTPFGELIITTLDGDAIVGRMLLVYKVKGEILEIDQPSAPRIDRLLFQVTANTLTIGREPDLSLLIREDPQTPSDSLAYLLAIGSAAISHALHSAHAGSPFIPFLIADSDSGRSLTRFVTNTPAEAQGAAKQAAKDGHPIACAYGYDGYVREQGNRLDGVIVEVSRSGMADGLILTQAYTFNNGKAVRAGITGMQPNPSWL